MAQSSGIAISTITGSISGAASSQVVATSIVTETSKAIPLTTLFTPAPSCNDYAVLDFVHAVEGTTFFSKDGHATSSECYPESYREYQFTGQSAYSPGACPQNYDYVSTGTGGIDRETTLAVCCPAGFSTDGNNFQCTQQETARGGVTVRRANPISVEWQASDLPLFTPASLPEKALARQPDSILTPALTPVTGVSGQAVDPGASASLAGAPGLSPTYSGHLDRGKSSTSLSAGAAAGAGVGATLGAIAIICGLLWLFKRYKITARNLKTLEEVDEKGVAYYEVDGSDKRRLAELDPERHVLEAASTEKPLEADGQSVRMELEGDLGSKHESKVQVISDVSSTNSSGR